MKPSLIKKKLKLYTALGRGFAEVCSDTGSIADLADMCRQHPTNVLNRHRSSVSQKTSYPIIDYWSRSVTGRVKRTGCFYAAISV